MKQLELKDICGYLPYALKSANRYVGQFGLTKPLVEHVTPFNVMKYLDYSTKSQIILRPLSDLTKEITHKGEKFIPIEEINKYTPLENYMGFKFEYDNIGQFGLRTPESWLPYIDYYKSFQKIQEWMFDIHGLIESGLAIDLNTLDENIY